MLKSNKILFALYVGIAAIFMIGVFKLFVLRFEAGDVYPPYSSLRSDPLGTKAFYESLENLKAFTVRRNYRPLSKLHSDGGATLFFLGADTNDLKFVHENTLKAITRFVAGGGRLVIAFMPETRCPDIERSNPSSEKQTEKPDKKKADKDPKGSNKGKSTESTSIDSKEDSPAGKDADLSWTYSEFFSLTAYWGVDFGHEPETKHLKYAEKALHSQTLLLPDTISCHTILYFDKLHDAWNKIYTCDNHPVIVERQYGLGSIVLSADTFLLSNEALLMERHPELLTWFIGHNTALVFDESHFGINKPSGVAGLARKYNLHWLFLGLILLAGLFIWKNSVYFVPPFDHDASTPENHLSSEKDYTEGLISLLRRNISNRDILRVCFEEWKRTFSHDRDLLKNKLSSMQTVIDTENPPDSKEGDPISGYKTICKILSERNR